MNLYTITLAVSFYEDDDDPGPDALLDVFNDFGGQMIADLTETSPAAVAASVVEGVDDASLLAELGDNES